MPRNHGAILALPILFLTACGGSPMNMGTGGGTDCPDDCPEPENSLYFATSRVLDGEAVVNLEYIPTWGTPGAFGWHTQSEDLSGDVELSASQSFIEGAISGEDFSFDEIVCVRVSVSYGDDCEDNPDYDTCQWLCEGNGSDAAFTTAFTYDWFGEDWSTETWSDPGGEGCSLLACR